MKTLVKHDFWCGFPNMFQTFIQRLRSTRSPPLSAPDQPRSVPGGSMVASTANRLPEPSLSHGLERAPHDVRALRVLVPAYRGASAASSISRTIGR